METLAPSLPPAFRHHHAIATTSPYVPPLPPPAAPARASFQRPTRSRQLPRQVLVAVVEWTRPCPGWYKLNFDGSVHHDGSGRASIGGVIRDWNGSTMLAFGERTPHDGVGEVEARALIRGLHLALQSGCDRLVVEGDDLTLVRLLRGDSPRSRICWATYDEIIRLLCCFRDAVVQHVYREGNQVADQLCKEAYHCPDVWTTEHQVPPAVWAMLESDRSGDLYPRFRPA